MNSTVTRSNSTATKGIEAWSAIHGGMEAERECLGHVRPELVRVDGYMDRQPDYPAGPEGALRWGSRRGIESGLTEPPRFDLVGEKKKFYEQDYGRIRNGSQPD